MRALALKFKWYLLAVLIFAGGAYALIAHEGGTEAAGQTFSVVQKVGRGEVSSGIETTGEIVAAQKLDLDVYKKASRIGAVNVQNGSHVDSGDVLVSFDKSDALVDARSSELAVTSAELSLQNTTENAADPNADIRTLENQVAGYEQSQDDAYRDFLNTDLTAVPAPGQASRLSGKAAPTVSGRYAGDAEGEYVITIYRSQTDSGYSFQLSGLEGGLYSIYSGQAVDLGTKGLKIAFPSSIAAGDSWVVAVPNVNVATYAETKADYDKTVRDTATSLENAKQNLANAKQTDTGAYRNLDVAKAQSALSEAKQKLSQSYDTVEERDIVAPFSGSVQDMENVVVGATPTGGSEDTINLGTLVSDAYLATFTLDAADAAKVSVGQNVRVTVTSYAEQPTFTGTISEISSLPTDSGVAEYEVRAALDYDAATATTTLREGMLADIVIVQEEKDDALRVPTSAITYLDGKPTVQVVGALTDEQQQQLDRLGVVRTDGAALSAYPVTVALGIKGRYYTEVTGGLAEGDLILSTQTETASETASTVQQAGFGAPQGAVRRAAPSGDRTFRVGG
jgi:multidrug resistance efflux pump